MGLKDQIPDDALESARARYRVKIGEYGADSANGPKDPLAPQNKERTTHRRKNRRTWCRGKKGEEHVTEIVLLAPSWWDEYHGEDDPKCYWWRGANIWFCRHQEICVNCGKILQHSLGDKCPDKR